MKQLFDKIKESLISVVPITAIVLLLCLTTLVPLSAPNIVLFVVGALFLIVGLSLFQLGSQVALTPIGEHIGAAMPRIKKWWLLIAICFIIGVVVTVAEPDLQVLATQVAQALNNDQIGTVLVWAVAFGVGLFLVVAVLRIFLKVKLNTILFISYGILMLAAIFTDGSFLPMAFDSGGVTTGPVTVPFILAIGIGIAAIKGGNSNNEDSFGLVALCSVGPILAVLILGIAVGSPADYPYVLDHVGVDSFAEIPMAFLSAFPKYMKEVGITVLPIGAFFLIFDLIFIKLPKRQLLRITIGMGYTFIGLVIFLTGVNVGFMPAGTIAGNALGALGDWKYILIPIGMIIGAVLVLAEPAVHVLDKQVEQVSGGTIKASTMMLTLSVGNAVSVGLAMLRVVTGIPIWYILIPVYAVALILTFFVPRVYTAIAFDSGGVASGPMTATFLLPFAMGACAAVGGNVLTDAFGAVAFVAMTPLVAVQLVGLVVKVKQAKIAKRVAEHAAQEEQKDIIEF